MSSIQENKEQNEQNLSVRRDSAIDETVEPDEGKEAYGDSLGQGSRPRKSIPQTPEEAAATRIQRNWRNHWDRLNKLAIRLSSGMADYCSSCSIDRYVLFDFASGKRYKRASCYPCIIKDNTFAKWLYYQYGNPNNRSLV